MVSGRRSNSCHCSPPLAISLCIGLGEIEIKGGSNPMTRPNIVAGILLAAFLIGANAYGHTLDGEYGGQADGVDANGTELHQITKWTFNSGTLVAFREIISFGQLGGSGTPIVTC